MIQKDQKHSSQSLYAFIMKINIQNIILLVSVDVLLGQVLTGSFIIGVNKRVQL